MSNNLLMGLWRYIIPIPPVIWQRQMSGSVKKIAAGLGFMAEDHHQVRNFVVRELPRVGEPLSPGLIGQKLNLSVSRVNVILDELEKHLTFLFRNEQGAVAWAYPVTVEKTPHHVTFSTGEQGYAA
jgi:hypothetical protein